MEAFKVYDGIYIIGGPDISHPYDCAVYLVVAGDKLIIIDSGAGESFNILERNIQTLGFNPQNVTAVIATHAHLDHSGCFPALYKKAFPPFFSTSHVANMLHQ